MMKDKERIYAFLAAAAFLAIFAIMYRGLLEPRMLLFGDLHVFPPNPYQGFNAFFYAWQPIMRGVTAPAFPYLPVLSILSILAAGQAALAQRIYLLLPLPLAFAAMYLSLRPLIPSRAPRFLAAFFYAVNQPVVGNIFLGGTVGMAYVYAFFPAMVRYSWETIASPARRIHNFLLSVLFLTLSLSQSTSPYPLILLMPLILAALVVSAWKRSIGIFLRALAVYFGITLAAFLLLLPVTAFSIPYLLPFLAPSLDAQGPRVPLSSYVVDVLYNYNCGAGDSRTEYISCLTSGYAFAPAVSGENQISNWFANISILLPILILIVPFLFLTGPVSSEDKKRMLAAMGGVALAAIILILIYAVHIKLIIKLFMQFPVLLAFRNFGKPILLLLYAAGLALAVGADRLQAVVRSLFQKKVSSSLLSILILLPTALIFISWAGYNSQAFSGSMGLQLDNVAVPASITSAASWLAEKHSSQGFFRVLWIPFRESIEGPAFIWLEPNIITAPQGYESRLGFSATKNYTRAVLAGICNPSEKHIGALMAPLSARYIVIMRNSGSGADCTIDDLTDQIEGNFSWLVAHLDQQEDLRKVMDTDGFVAYENTAFIPHVALFNSAASNISASNIAYTPVVAEESPVKLRVKMPSSSNSYLLYFAEPYDSRWVARTNGQQIQSQKLGYGNSFILPPGASEVELYFTGQDMKNLLNVIFGLSWISLIAALLVTRRYSL